jgi:hypothetical protein
MNTAEIVICEVKGDGSVYGTTEVSEGLSESCSSCDFVSLISLVNPPNYSSPPSTAITCPVM